MQTSTSNLANLEAEEAVVDGGEAVMAMTLLHHIHRARLGRAIHRAVAVVKAGGQVSGLELLVELRPVTLLAEWQRTTRIPMRIRNAAEAVGLAEATQRPVPRDTTQQGGQIRIRATLHLGMRAQDLGRLAGGEAQHNSAVL